MDRHAGIDAMFAHGATSRILHVARGTESADAVSNALREAGVADVESVLDGRLALPAFRQRRPDVVILDAEVDGFDALSVARQVGSRVAHDELLPIIVLAEPGRAAALRASLNEVVSVFLREPSDAVGIALLVRELAAVRGNGRFIADSLARRLAGTRRLEVETAHHLALFAQLKDHPDSRHVFRVGQLSSEIACALGFEPDEIDLIRDAAPLHDTGKIGIPDSILNKEEPLTLDEMDVVKKHTTIGAAILAGSTSPLFQMAEEIALFHHENWDGTGYTPGLEAEAIPLTGRIVRVVDSFDALTSARPFAERWHRHHALDFIREQAGQAFDPRVVEAFLDVVGDVPADELARGAV